MQLYVNNNLGYQDVVVLSIRSSRSLLLVDGRKHNEMFSKKSWWMDFLPQRGGELCQRGFANSIDDVSYRQATPVLIRRFDNDLARSHQHEVS